MSEIYDLSDNSAMQETEISQIGRELKVRRLMSVLYIQLRHIRPTLSKDTVYRAFAEVACNSDLLHTIRLEGKRLLEENKAVLPAA